MMRSNVIRWKLFPIGHDSTLCHSNGQMDMVTEHGRSLNSRNVNIMSDHTLFNDKTMLTFRQEETKKNQNAKN